MILKLLIITLIFIVNVNCKSKKILHTIVSPSEGPEPSNDTTSSYLYEQIHILHQNGQEFISRKYYSRASLYYTAILQLLDEHNTTYSQQELRAKCLTSLSFCDFKTDQYYDTIARCTDIIDNFSSSDTTEQQFIKLLGKAYYRRGLALYILGLPNLALSDLKTAQDFLPGDDKINGKINQIYDENNKTEVDTSQDNVEEMLENIIVYAKNVTYSKKKLLTTEIEALISNPSKSDNTKPSLPDFNINSLFNSPLTSPINSSKKINLSSIISQVETFAPMIQKMTGIDNKTLKNSIDVVRAIFNCYMLFNRLFQQIKHNSGFVVAFIWLLLTALRL